MFWPLESSSFSFQNLNPVFVSGDKFSFWHQNSQVLISVYRLLVYSLATVPNFTCNVGQVSSVNIPCSLTCSNSAFKAFILFGVAEIKLSLDLNQSQANRVFELVPKCTWLNVQQNQPLPNPALHYGWLYAQLPCLKLRWHYRLNKQSLLNLRNTST